MSAPDVRRRWFAPEVIQSSAMDCGPAALKCLLDGHGIAVSYGRLREACQTEVDGTSIDTIEQVARTLGLDAEQVMSPADHVLRPEAALLPALAVSRLPNGAAHFVVLWRRRGSFVQVMDPATGRRWVSWRRLLDDLFIHETEVPEDRWLEWAQSAQFQRVLRSRLRALGCGDREAMQAVNLAKAEPGWRPLAALDAAARLVAALSESGAIPRRQAAVAVARLAEWAAIDGPDLRIPAPWWTVRPATATTASSGTLVLRGAVLVSVKGRRKGVAEDRATEPQLPSSLVTVLEPQAHPGRRLLHLLAADGVLAPLVLASALLLSAGGLMFEALLFRGLLDLGRDLGLSGQRLAAALVVILLLGGLLWLEWPMASLALRLGRRAEMRLRVAFLSKLPRLGDRYLRSRLHSDMAERSHSLQRIRSVPELGVQLLRSFFQLVMTAAGIVWLDPSSLPLVAVATIGAAGVPFLFQPLLIERDLRVRSHAGSLSRFYLDGLLGLVAIRTHRAERAVCREHESLLIEWGRAGRSLLRAVVTVEVIELGVGFGCAVLLVLGEWARAGEAGSLLLLVYWALNLPVLGSEVAQVARQYPAERNVMMRVLELLGAPEESAHVGTLPAASGRSAGVSIAFDAVTVTASGRRILEGLSVSIDAGAHVAIVGASGAGKSSLVGLLLGWHTPSSGRVRVDGEPLEGAVLATVRRSTAWVDPETRLWNRALLDNLRYGAAGPAVPLPAVIEGAELRRVIERLPNGLQTRLGEGGALVSGGEGQRVRLGRALSRPDVRLAILDEPFRGLDRKHRQSLMAGVRRAWANATLLCITHDVAETLAFDRVLVVHDGRVVEDGAPSELAQAAESRYRSLLDAEQLVRAKLWAGASWRRLHVDAGRISDSEVA